MPVTCGYVFRGGIWDSRRPLCVRGHRVPGYERSADRGGTGHGRPRTSPRTTAETATDGAGGSGYADRLRPNSRSELQFQDACSMSPSPSSPGSSSASGMPRARRCAGRRSPGRRCSGVDLEQDRDAVPGAAGDLGGGHPEFSHRDTAACRRSRGGGRTATGTGRG